jgi:predicted GNAT family acetyltransferase
MSSSSDNTLKIRHTSQVVYVILPDKSKAYLKYNVENGIMKLIETYTPPQYRGKGLASLLVKYAVDLAKSNNWLIEPICSYAIYFFMKNPDYRYILTEQYKKLSEQGWQRLLEEAKLREEQKKDV